MKRFLALLLFIPAFCTACDPTWESVQLGYQGVKLWRLRVDRGWQVFIEGDFNSGIIFKTDPLHRWAI